MSVKHILRDFISPPAPNYFGEFVEGELNNYKYEGTVLASHGNGLYLIITEDGHRQVVKNIRRKYDFGRRQ